VLSCDCARSDHGCAPPGLMQVLLDKWKSRENRVGHAPLRRTRQWFPVPAFSLALVELLAISLYHIKNRTIFSHGNTEFWLKPVISTCGYPVVASFQKRSKCPTLFGTKEGCHGIRRAIRLPAYSGCRPRRWCKPALSPPSSPGLITAAAASKLPPTRRSTSSSPPTATAKQRCLASACLPSNGRDKPESAVTSRRAIAAITANCCNRCLRSKL